MDNIKELSAGVDELIALLKKACTMAETLAAENERLRRKIVELEDQIDDMDDFRPVDLDELKKDVIEMNKSQLDSYHSKVSLIISAACQRSSAAIISP